MIYQNEKACKKKRSKRVESGRSDAWWQNMVNGLSADNGLTACMLVLCMR